jgi:hypothetical protein
VDESNQYREWLQKSLLTEGWEAAFDHQQLTNWVRNNRALLMTMARSCHGNEETVKQYESVVQDFSPSTKYDLPTTEAIFRPLFDEIVECAKETGLKSVRDVELVTSTSISPTPFALPTSGTHQLPSNSSAAPDSQISIARKKARPPTPVNASQLRFFEPHVRLI